MQPFLIALQLLTIVPVRIKTPVENKHMGQSLLYYPLIGFIVASVLVLLGWLLNTQSDNVTAILLLLVWVVLTGGLHLDGLADSADAWLGGIGDKNRTLAIMKDPACGPIAVAALVLLLLAKFVMLTVLIASNDWFAIIVAIILARTAMPLLFLTTPYVREGGIASVMITHQPQTASKLMLIVIGLLTIASGNMIPLLVTAGLFLLLRYWMQQRLGGTTGDTAGAMVEILETAVLMTAVII
ncbi:MAG: adenosylcobinamide-GDP ribazoletransferase [Gammaproteobacteria bacterium]|nr:adenosylcobinamide-GDP ribazoletransferase [Gammaproteobacteria bacterium]MDH5592444.1 adenosylcobinamide-GDP ribazoletransferase [Gammaproteobacteria bacterium]